MKPPFRAVVLTAGLGERLRPLTDWLPKPLLPIAGKPLVLHTLELLAAAGCAGAALNLHHLGEPIRRRLGDAVDGMPLTYSEEREILGTLGALVRLREFAGDEPLMVINGDSLCRWPIARLLRAHQRSGAEATLLMSARADPAEFGSPVSVGRDGAVISFRGGAAPEGSRRRIFAGAHVVSPRLLEGRAEEPADVVRDLYIPMLARGERIQTVATRRPWHDLGTPVRYLRGARDWGRGRGLGRLFRRSWVGSNAQVGAGAKLVRSVVERDARVAAGAVVERSLVLPGGRVSEDCRVCDSIVGFEAELQPGTVVDRRLVTQERADVHPRPGDSMVGGLIYSPMGDARGRR